jgi:hypothetical protein
MIFVDFAAILVASADLRGAVQTEMTMSFVFFRCHCSTLPEIGCAPISD